ncbi:MAG: hypothetical protein JWO02_89 [Solirubrobacterales bacterium]|nr:hypothetical protein [Solirubrobacterales bacterium]
MPVLVAANRSDGSPARPAGCPVPPERMPLVRDGRPLKAWRYVGLYGEDLMLCAGRVRIGGVPQAFWAVWDREVGVLHERTTWSPRQVALPDGQVRVRGHRVRVDLRLDPFGDPVDVMSPHGASWIWTRKTLAGATGTVTLGGRVRQVRGTALIDDSAGYHARATDWEWSAGVGTLADGRAVAWNLVAGVHDTPAASERSVWVQGRAHEVGPVTFAPALDGVVFAETGALQFTAEAVRERHDHAGPLRSDYIQPFGAFRGTLPGAGALATGFGVMERHSARW